MEFTVEDVSPVKKKVNVSVPAEEVKAALATAAATIGQDLQIDGFRKGKVPASLIRQRFGASIEKEARESLINVHINEVLGKLGVNPISGISMEGEENELEEGKPFAYSMEFEVLPKFDLPSYEGLEVEEESSEPKKDVVDNVIKGVMQRMARLEPAEGNGPAQNGQIAVIDFEFFEDGKPMPNYKSSNFELPIGGGAALKEFENLVTTIPVGHTADGSITFPEDFIAPELAGKTVDVKVTVHAVKERKLPELNDDLAKELGSESVDELWKKYEDVARSTLKYVHKAEAEHKLIDGLAKQTDFELPESVVRREVELLISDYMARMEQEGKRVDASREGIGKLKEQFMPHAQQRAREKIVLMSIAEKEKLEVTALELAEAVNEGARKFGENPQEYFHKLERTGMLQQLQEHLLCDKAMDLVYERANVEIVTPQEEGAEMAAAAAEETKE